MGDRKLLNDESRITKKEKNFIKKILKNYKLQVLDVKRVRSVYKVKTDIGNICLKQIRKSRKKPINGSILVEELNKHGFPYTAKYLKTSKGHLFVKHNKSYYYVTEWINGHECDLNDIEEARKCMKLLANFHITTLKIDGSKLKLRNNLKNWPKIFSNKLNELQYFKYIIENKRQVTNFDSLYNSVIDDFYNIGIASMNLLNSSDYYSLSKNANSKKSICHDSIYYQNIIKKGNDYYLIDLDSIKIDLHINDLGKVIRRLMFKKEYGWDFNKAKELIEAYSSVNPLSHSHLEAMLCIIVFPHKFWKLGKQRYIKKKHWNEKKYIKKLNKLIQFDSPQQKFIKDYIEYLAQ
ncbi:CotS family spore coat protein [Clostridium cochlearium]|uniref:CotS family spore coat protein n=1 Tax=Clostridium cochlearium TaxID=1494 RepID=UPI001570DB30|nr:CotS family spore coat protein [Clostridium cochlearium]MBV1819566.1 CotS family spore coat protein [Bacteroidales bacterium MSK.15.36]NMA58410.1 CotS family spore coat protein [Clostridium cochlearium]NSJ90632.1 CotS family spore coat protein [Coprococcus sp. MSK.21.13]